MYTAEQIDDAIQAKYASYPDEFYDTIERREIYLPALDVFAEFVKSYEPESQGDQWMLFKVEGQFFRKYGYYSSWDSPTWDGRLVEVVQREVTVTKYVDKD